MKKVNFYNWLIALKSSKLFSIVIPCHQSTELYSKALGPPWLKRSQGQRSHLQKLKVISFICMNSQVRSFHKSHIHVMNWCERRWCSTEYRFLYCRR